MNQLTHYDNTILSLATAKANLATIKNIDEVKAIMDKAEAFRRYAKLRGESLETQNMLADIRIWTEHRMGGLIKEQIPHQGGRPKKPFPCETVSPKLSDFGVSRKQSHRLQRVNDVPPPLLEKHNARIIEAERELTTASVLRLSRDIQEENSKAQVVSPDTPDKNYTTIVIDPPWPMQKMLREVRPMQDAFTYPTMTIEEIKDYPIPAREDSHLLLWTTQKFLPASFHILEHWGFRYVFTMVWHKPGGFQPPGLAQYNCEFVLYARQGSPAFIDTKAFFCCFTGQRREHSRKPDFFYQLIERVTPAPRIDIFSREKHSGFDQYGDETERF